MVWSKINCLKTKVSACFGSWVSKSTAEPKLKREWSLNLDPLDIRFLGHPNFQNVLHFGKRTFPLFFLLFVLFYLFSSFVCIYPGQPTMGWNYTNPLSSQLCFEPTLHGRYSHIYNTWFYCRSFYTPSGEQGRLRRTNSQVEHTLAGSQFCLFGFWNFYAVFQRSL